MVFHSDTKHARERARGGRGRGWRRRREKKGEREKETDRQKDAYSLDVALIEQQAMARGGKHASSSFWLDSSRRRGARGRCGGLRG